MKIADGIWAATVLGGALASRASLAADATDAAGPAAPPTAERREDSEPATGETKPARHAHPLRTLGWVSLAIGAEAAVVASVTSILLLHEKSVRDDECNSQKTCSQRGLDANGTIASLSGWNAASWIVAAAGVGAGIALLLTSRPESGLRATVAVAPHGAGVGLRGDF